MAQVFQLICTVYADSQMRREVVYGISSLMPTRANAACILALVRAHWRIENRLHWRRDVTLREDHCQVRKGQAPRILVVLNSFLLALLDCFGVSNVSQRRRIKDAPPLLAVRLLLGSLLTFKSPCYIFCYILVHMSVLICLPSSKKEDLKQGG